MSSKALSGPPKPASASATIGANQWVPLLALGVLDLVGALERAVDAPDDLRDRVRRVEALVRVGLPGGVGVGRDLPAGQVDRLEAGLHHLHGLVPGERAERVHVRLGRGGAPTAGSRPSARACARCAPSRAAAPRRSARVAADDALPAARVGVGGSGRVGPAGRRAGQDARPLLALGLEQLVGGEGDELDELGLRADALEQRARLLEAAALEARRRRPRAGSGPSPRRGRCGTARRSAPCRRRASTPWWIHCHAREREISTVAASSIRL